MKTVPEHFTPVSTASQAEVDQVFGEEGERKVGAKDAHFFHIGAPLDMESVKITLNLERLVERSSGVFGKSGTGKTFLARLLLAGVIQRARGGQPDLRHAQRVRLGGQLGADQPGQGAQADLPRPGQHLHPGR